MFDPRQTVYSVKGVTVIPLIESRARDALNILRVRNHTSQRPSLISGATGRGSLEDNTLDSINNVDERSGGFSSHRVKFAAEDQVKVMSPLPPHLKEESEGDPDRSPSPSPSVVSTPSSEFSDHTTNLTKTLADKLSFWNRLSKRDSQLQSGSVGDALTRKNGFGRESSSQGRESGEERISLDDILENGVREPGDVLNTILATAPPPQTAEQKNSELEDKVIRECVSQFTRGGMYFAYTFGMFSPFSFCHILI